MLPLYVENKKGSQRHWYDPHNNEKGSTHMHYAYGYVKGTLGLDGDEVDVYIGPCVESRKVFVVTQMKAPDFIEVDEQKCFVYFETVEQVREAYLNQYNDPRFLGSISTLPMEEFKSQLETPGGFIMGITKALKKEYYSARITKVVSTIKGPIMDREEATKILKSVSTVAKRAKEYTESLEPVDKALTSHIAAPMARQAARAEHFRTLAATEAGVGTVRTPGPFEPPVVPVRQVVAPLVQRDTTADSLSDCGTCGIVYKSVSGCPRCAKASTITESVGIRPLRGR